MVSFKCFLKEVAVTAFGILSLQYEYNKAELSLLYPLLKKDSSTSTFNMMQTNFVFNPTKVPVSVLKIRVINLASFLAQT